MDFIYINCKLKAITNIICTEHSTIDPKFSIASYSAKKSFYKDRNSLKIVMLRDLIVHVYVENIKLV